MLRCKQLNNLSISNKNQPICINIKYSLWSRITSWITPEVTGINTDVEDEYEHKHDETTGWFE